MSRQEFFNPHGDAVLASLPIFLLTSTDLSLGAKVTYAILCYLSNVDGTCSAPQALIASRLGLSSVQVKRYVKELQLMRYISISRDSRRKPNTYRFLWKPEWPNLHLT